MGPYRNLPSQLKLYSIMILHLSIWFQILKGKMNYIQHTLRTKKHPLQLTKTTGKNGYVLGKHPFSSTFTYGETFLLIMPSSRGVGVRVGHADRAARRLGATDVCRKGRSLCCGKASQRVDLCWNGGRKPSHLGKLRKSTHPGQQK